VAEEGGLLLGTKLKVHGIWNVQCAKCVVFILFESVGFVLYIGGLFSQSIFAFYHFVSNGKFAFWKWARPSWEGGRPALARQLPCAVR